MNRERRDRKVSKQAKQIAKNREIAQLNAQEKKQNKIIERLKIITKRHNNDEKTTLDNSNELKNLNRKSYNTNSKKK
tara:strand:+ start:318 stop:548 length:231 start_codon:yes stop_codon:yes gene_type:complete